MDILGVLNSPWAILPEKLLEIQAIYGAHLRGEHIDIAAIEAKLGKPLNNNKSLGYSIIGGVAIVPIEGVISKRMNLFTQISGGVSTQLLQNDFAAALGDPLADSILLLVDSPGGSIDGLQQAADDIRAGRSVKPIYAFADGTMASAAYWIGSAAEKVFSASDTTAVGSIGVIAKHTDYSKAQEKDGIKVTDIYAGKYKALGSPNAPLSDEGRATIQAQVDHAYSVFVDAVAKNRGVSTRTVVGKMADGRVFFGKQAVEAGLVDGIASMPEVITQLTKRHGESLAGMSAAAAQPESAHEAQPILEAVREENKQVDVKDLAGKISAYVAEQAAMGNQVSYAQAAAHVDRSSQSVAPMLATITPNREKKKAVDVQGMAGKITDYVKKQAALNNRVSYAEAASHIEDTGPHATAEKINDYVAEQRRRGNRMSFAEAAAHIESEEKRGL
jgi:capsid assembly protease